MIVCLDTNTLVQALASGHPYHPILQAWISGRLTIAVSTSILLEYEEVITRMSGIARWQKFTRILELVEATSDNLIRVSPSFEFHIVTADPDDNKFTDCAITTAADYLISDDHHFAPLVDSGHKTKLIRPSQFLVTLSR